jgi:hypothetical protein
MQAVPPAFLAALDVDGQSYLLQEFQPSGVRVEVKEAWKASREKREELFGTLAEILAWDQLRSSGRCGAAAADDLVTFRTASGLPAQVLDYAVAYSEQVKRDHRAFRAALKSGELTKKG